MLSRWRPLFADLAIENLVHAHQQDYYQAIERSTEQTSATPFVELMPRLIGATLDSQPEPGAAPEQVTEQVTEQVRRLIRTLGQGTCSARSLMERLGLRHRPSFMQDYLQPAVAAGLVAMTDPDHPRSPRQAYRVTEAGQRLLERSEPEHSRGEKPRP